VNETLSIPLSSSWTNTTVSITAISKSSPVLNRPELWPALDGKSFYSWGGWRSYFLTNAGPIPASAPWQFTVDGNGGGTWKQLDTVKEVTRQAGGTGTVVNDTLFMLGGYASWTTSPETRSLRSFLPMPGIVSYNTTSRVWRNDSSAGYSRYGTSVFGHMEYLPEFGTQGLLAVLGGESTIPEVYKEDGSGLMPFDNIAIYDPATRRWYNQSTTGTQPSQRERFCAVGVKGLNGTYEM